MPIEKLRSNKNVTIGLKQTIKAIGKDLVQMVFIAQDADEKVLRPLIDLCKEKNVHIEYVPDKKELGRECNIQVGAAAVGLLK